VRRLALIVLSVSTACAPSAPSAPPAKLIASSATASASTQPPAPAGTAEPVVVPQRDRRGECDLGQALDVFLTGQEAVRCGDLPRARSDEDYERARACVIAAQRARKPFMLVWGGPNIDSVLREAVAARVKGGRYEVRWFSYDSCPSGCGDRDPTWSSARCEPLVDLRAACSALGRKKTPEDEDLRWLCDEDGVKKTRRRLELYCREPAEREMCGPTQL
jgi:hypothetical protein